MLALFADPQISIEQLFSIIPSIVTLKLNDQAIWDRASQLIAGQKPERLQNVKIRQICDVIIALKSEFGAETAAKFGSFKILGHWFHAKVSELTQMIN